MWTFRDTMFKTEEPEPVFEGVDPRVDVVELLDKLATRIWEGEVKVREVTQGVPEEDIHWGYTGLQVPTTRKLELIYVDE